MDDDKSGKLLPGDNLSKPARGEPPSVADEAASGLKITAVGCWVPDYLHCPLHEVAQDWIDPPASELTHKLPVDPTQQITKTLALKLGSNLASGAVNAGGMAAADFLAERFAQRPMLMAHGTLNALGATMPKEIDLSVIEALRDAPPLKIDSGFTSAIPKALKDPTPIQTLGNATKAFTAFDEWQRSVQKLAPVSLAGPTGGIASTGQWASTIGAVQMPDVMHLFGGKLDSNFTEAGKTFDTDFMATKLKMSVLPSIEEAFGWHRDLHFDPEHSLFGDWRMPETVPKGINLSVIDAVRGVQPLKFHTGFAGAIPNAQKALEEVSQIQTTGGATKAFIAFDELRRSVQKLLPVSFVDNIGGIASTGQWVSTIGAVQMPDVMRLLDLKLTSNFTEAGKTFDTDFVATKLNTSALSSIGETFDRHIELRFDPEHSLFGDWRMWPDLPESFWRDAPVRKHVYEKAEIDDGHVVTRPGIALEVMIERSFAERQRSEPSAVAVVTLGEVSMMVRSHGTRKDAYAILERFEVELRAYVSRTLEERFGPDWFKLRASNLLGKAKGVRRSAMERGEAFAPLIEFVELGELAGIVLNTKNWNEVFRDVFINHAEFDHDMQKLIAARRPTMHVRAISGVQLVEIVCVVQRLSNQIADDGAWKRAAAADR